MRHKNIEIMEKVMKNNIKTLLTALFILVMAICCLSACNDAPPEVTPCDHDLVEISRTENCTRAGTVEMQCSKCKGVFTESISPAGHDIQKLDAVDATCTKDGLTEGEICGRCELVIKEQEIVYGKHTEDILPAVAKTCTENGLTEGKYCTVCNEVLEAQQTVYASHNFEKTERIEPTCTTDGWEIGENCKDCGLVLTEAKKLPAGHVIESYEKLESTCTTDGHEAGERCVNCDYIKSGLDVIPAAHKPEVILGQEAIPATCTTEGLTEGTICTACYTVLTQQQTIPVIEHTPETISGYAATCTSEGLTDGKRCSVCEKTLEDQQPIEKASHQKVETLGFKATCTSTGISNGEKCKDCGKIFKSQYTLYSDGHQFDANGVCEGCSIQVTSELEYEEYPVSTFTLTGGSTTVYVVTGVQQEYTGTTIVIPETYLGYPVVGIKENAFSGNIYIEKVVLPKTITDIGENAFNGCISLEVIECSDFKQSENWNENWHGDATVKLTAIFNQGKTPYEIYIEAMNSIANNYTNYTWTTTSKMYLTSTWGEEVDGYLAKMTEMIQKQSSDNFYFNQTDTDYMTYGPNTQPAVDSKSHYYVDGYYYELYEKNYVRAKASKEWWYGSSMTNTASIEITPEHFENVVFYKDANGKMYLELAFDEVVFTQMIEDTSNTTIPGLITHPVYKYVFNADGYLETYGYTSGIRISSYDQDDMTLEMQSSFTDINKTNIYAPAYTHDFTPPTCTEHTVETAPAVAPTCHKDGNNEFSYCSTCYASITEISMIPAEHKYENGECTTCGTFENTNISTGLAYMLNDDENGYILIGIGQCDDTNVYVPTYIYGMPVVEIKANAFENSAVENITIGNESYTIAEFTGWTKQ